MPATKERTYNETEISERLKELPGWYYEDGWIRRVYKTDGWPTTLMLVNAIGYLAEAAYHHPDLSVTWGRVIVKLQNHAAGGITRQGLRAGPEDRGGHPLEATRRRAGGHAQQVGTAGGSEIGGEAGKRGSGTVTSESGTAPVQGSSLPAPPLPRRVLFVTGKLAEPALRRVLNDMQPPFQPDVAVMKITVAALMTTPWIARFLEVPPETDLVLIPGLCEGDTAVCGSDSECESRKDRRT